MQTLKQFVDNKEISLYRLAKITGKSVQQIGQTQDTWRVIETSNGFVMCNIKASVEFSLGDSE